MHCSNNFKCSEQCRQEIGKSNGRFTCVDGQTAVEEPAQCDNCGCRFYADGRKETIVKKSLDTKKRQNS